MCVRESGCGGGCAGPEMKERVLWLISTRRGRARQGKNISGLRLGKDMKESIFIFPLGNTLNTGDSHLCRPSNGSYSRQVIISVKLFQ